MSNLRRMDVVQVRRSDNLNLVKKDQIKPGLAKSVSQSVKRSGKRGIRSGGSSIRHALNAFPPGHRVSPRPRP